jgi:hypothetical protein
MAFSSEVGTGSREENASKKESSAPSLWGFSVRRIVGSMIAKQ